MSQQSIGVFDSGLGGLTALKELRDLLPNENFIYFGDTARVPYGSHSRETLIRFAQQDRRFMLQYDLKSILVACGTVSSVALNELKSISPVPITGVIDAAARAAANRTKTGDVLVLATNATVRSHAYRNAVLAQNPRLRVQDLACPLFVPLIEHDYVEHDNIITRMVVADYFKKVTLRNTDTVILGCTHYPIIKSIIAEYAGGASIIESGLEAAKEMAAFLEEKQMRSEQKKNGITRFYVSENVENFQSIGARFLGDMPPESTEKIDIDRY